MIGLPERLPPDAAPLLIYKQILIESALRVN